MEKNLKIDLTRPFLSVILGLSLYFLIYLPIEFLLTEVFFVTPKINSLINTAVLLFFITLTNLFNLKVNKNKLKTIALLILFFVSLIFYTVYHKEKLNREYLPKIYRTEPSWIIQGQSLKISGINFGRSFEEGKIMVGEMEFLVKYWSENKIIAEAPVPSKEGFLNLSIKTDYGEVSNVVVIEIKNPDYLKRYLE